MVSQVVHHCVKDDTLCQQEIVTLLISME